MNNNIVKIAANFVLLLLAQVLICNHINFLGYLNPYIYTLFIIFFPVKNDRALFLIISFLMGLCIDLFSDTGGIHAAACVTIAVLRPAVLKFCFGAIYEHQTMKFYNVDFIAKITYMAILIGIHHFILFLLEIFNIAKFLSILQKTITSGVFTLFLSILIRFLFSRKNT